MFANYEMAKKFRNKAREEKENRAAKIAVDLYNNGIISNTAQRSISGETIRKAWENYCKGELARQAEGKDGKRGSTGTFGKAADSFNRCKKAYNRELSLDIVDIACRPAGLVDITIQCDEKARETLEKSRVTCELKSGGGCVASGASIDECWQVIADACDAGKWIVWYFDYRGFDVMAADAWDKFDELPCIFLPMDTLAYHLEEFKGNVETWFKVNGETTINFQTVLTSEKKTSWLYHIYDEYSFDWPTFRDWGKLVKVNG